MANQMSIMAYFFQAGFVVKTVMLLLGLSSIVSWTLIIQRAWYFRAIKEQYDSFSEQFWSSRDLSKLYQGIESKREKTHGISAIFHEGFKEFLRGRKSGVFSLESIQRVMQIRYAKEVEHLEQHLSLFSTVSSIAPYVGLFGTVWGIMAALQALGQASQATIAMVAPGISEALVATALGLFTAIPAAIAYHRYTSRANGLLDRYEVFQEELLNLITQQVPVRGGE